MADEKTPNQPNQTAPQAAQGAKGPVAQVQEAPVIPSPNPVQPRPSREALEKAREKSAKDDDPDTVYEVTVSQWGHDDNRFTRGQLVMRDDVPEGYDFNFAKRAGTIVASSVSKADYQKMQKDATAAALEAEGLK
jgi:hypothetical protein